MTAIPNNWRLAAIGNVAEVNPPGSTVIASDDSLVSFVPMAAVAEVSGHIDLSVTKRFGDVKKGFTRFKDGDVLFAKITPSMENGKIAVARNLHGGHGCGTTEFHVIRPRDGIEADYLRYFLVRSNYRQEARRNMQGAVGQQRVPADFVRDSQVPVAPSAEQKRIVSKIDELFSSIEEGEHALERVQKLVERYRQSVLKAAVTGELTREWREKHKGKPESGKALLARVLKARREAWEAAELEKMKAKGIKPVNDKWKDRYEEPVQPDESKLPELPVGWTWAAVDQLTTKITSGSRDWKEYYGRGSGVFVMAQNVRPRRLDMSEVQHVDPPKGDRDAERSEIALDDVLVTIVGANTGDVCRVREPVSNYYVCQSVALARPVFGQMSEFLEAFLCAQEGGQAQFAETIYGAGRPHLSFDQLKTTHVPIPPLDEQNAICNLVNKAESDMHGILTSIASASRTAAGLRQSVLGHAFRGLLVAQRSDDEPASVLLQRIAAQYGEGDAAAKRGRKNREAA